MRREGNQEADDLTNGDFTKFDSRLRMEVDLAKIKWLVLGDVLDWSKEIYDQVVAERNSNHPGGPVKHTEKWATKGKRLSGSQRLKTAQPW
jgi:hypothetical protein